MKTHTSRYSLREMVDAPSIVEVIKSDPIFPYQTGLHYRTVESHLAPKESKLVIYAQFYSEFLDRPSRRGRPDSMILDSLPQIERALADTYELEEFFKVRYPDLFD